LIGHNALTTKPCHQGETESILALSALQIYDTLALHSMLVRCVALHWA